MRKILAILLIVLSTSAFAQNASGPNFDIVDFNQKMEVVEWLCHYKQIQPMKDTISLSFNQYIKENEDKTITVWILPAFQPNNFAIYGGEFIYTIDQFGTTILKDESYFPKPFRGFKVGERRPIRLNYKDTEKPTLGAIFFAWYYKEYFTEIEIYNAKTTSMPFKVEDGYSWIHVEREDLNNLEVKPCNEKIYSVENTLLEEKFGDLSEPKTGPTFTGGIEELKKYFAANPLTDEKAKNMFFMVHIGFLVNCEGKAGNFVVISHGKGELEKYANQVLEIVSKMPQQWQPAIVKRKPVDCYQVLSFSVKNGQLDAVSYR